MAAVIHSVLVPVQYRTADKFTDFSPMALDSRVSSPIPSIILFGIMDLEKSVNVPEYNVMKVCFDEAFIYGIYVMHDVARSQILILVLHGQFIGRPERKHRE